MGNVLVFWPLILIEALGSYSTLVIYLHSDLLHARKFLYIHIYIMYYISTFSNVTSSYRIIKHCQVIVKHSLAHMHNSKLNMIIQ